MFAKFFIDRPIFAAVISIIVFAVGLASISKLPIARFPEITPPAVQISATYPGANAETVAQSLAAPIEQELSGAKNLLYFQSNSGNDGSLRVTATFEIGSDVDLAAVEVQNLMKRAEPRLPAEVLRQGVTVSKSTNSILMVAALKSSDPQHDTLFLGNYATINILDAIRRVPGVGDVRVFPTMDYSMRVWINPDEMAARNLTVTDISNAIRDQNGLYAGGRVGAEPSPDGQQLTLSVVTPGRFATAEEFGDIILRSNPNGSYLRLKDVARVELNSQSYDLVGRLNSEPTTFIIVNLQSDGNALQATKGIRATLDELKQDFPAGMDYDVPFDTSPFIRVAIIEVAETFGMAILLVSAVVLLFLGTARATIIPLMAVPVAIIGAFAGMWMLGFSINTLTLFGLVLAIGIVVDDAIIVVENVERIMHEEHLPPREATIRAMSQVTSPIIAIVLVLIAVFLPVGFLGGLTGELYRQFAITIAVSVTISGFVALTLSPALCAAMLRPNQQKFIFFRWFDAAFELVQRAYTWFVRQTIAFGLITAAVFIGMLWGTWSLFQKVPSGFIPQEDQGFFVCAVSLPQGASLDRTVATIAKVEGYLRQQPEVRRVVALGGMDLFAGFSPATNGGVMFVALNDWAERRGKEQSADELIKRTNMAMGGTKEGFVLAFAFPPISGLGMRAGYEYQLQSRTGADVREIAGVTDKLVAAASARPELNAQSMRPVINVTNPQYSIDVDRNRAKMLGLSLGDVYNTLQALLGSFYVNDFSKYGRIYRVQLEAEKEFRSSPEVLRSVYVRNDAGKMVPLAGVVNTSFVAGPNLVSRFNSFPSVQITGEPAAGYSSGQAIQAMEEASREALPNGYTFSWSGASYQEIKAGKQAPYMIAFGLFVVFLVLAAQYERWSLPLAVLLGIPSGAFGAILAVHLRHMPKDIYFQIGLLTVIGLAAKNAILIVEFASVLRENGHGLVESAIEAARVRLRPFMMTSLAFILGVTPLVLSHGAGAAGRHSMGTGVMGGMIAATILDMIFVPLCYVVVEGVSEWLAGGVPIHKVKKASLDSHDAQPASPGIQTSEAG